MSTANPQGPSGPSPAEVERTRQAHQVRTGANWFIWIAGLSLVNSVLFAVGTNWAFFLGLGVTQFADAIGHDLITGTTGLVLALLFDILIAAIFVGLALVARKGTPWAFIVGMVLFVLDALLLVWVTDWASVAFHALALYFLFRGFQASRRLAALRSAAVLPPGIVPPITPR